MNKRERELWGFSPIFSFNPHIPWAILLMMGQMLFSGSAVILSLEILNHLIVFIIINVNIFILLTLTFKYVFSFDTRKCWLIDKINQKSFWWNQLLWFPGIFVKLVSNSGSHIEFVIKPHAIHFLVIFIPCTNYI